MSGFESELRGVVFNRLSLQLAELGACRAGEETSDAQALLRDPVTVGRGNSFDDSVQA
jgi:hypothetical protein